MNIQGKIKMIGETKTFGNNGFKKREFVITTDEQYPQDILIEMVQDKVDLLDSFSIGDSIDVSINLRGREWVNPQGETKYFNSIQGWRIEKTTSSTGESDPDTGNFEKIPKSELNDGYKDDLPF